MQIIIQCDNKINPMGVYKKPIFGWICKTEDKRQLAYTIAVFDEENNVFWNSSRVDSDKTQYIEYEGKPLLSHTKYLWNVTVETENGEYKSDIGYFVTGIFDKDICAKWITADFEEAFFLNKRVTLESIPPSVYAYVCGLGYFELYINDKKAGDDYFVPNQTDYDEICYSNLKYPFEGVTKKRVNYLCYDIAKYLKCGENTIKIHVGNGWYNETKRKTEGSFVYGKPKAFLQIHCGDKIIVTDESWGASESFIKKTNIFYGEEQDANINITEEKNAIATNAPRAEFLPQFAPTDKVCEVINPTQNGNIFDCKKDITGFAYLVVKGEKYSTVKIRYAEEVKEGNTLDFKSAAGYEPCDINQIQEDTFVLSGNGEEVLKPHFTWHGFRFFEIISDAEIISAKALCIHTALKQTGWFECSNELINKIHGMFINSQKTAVHGAVPMDCPHRERLGYTGDGQCSSYSSMLLFDGRSFYKKWIEDILDAQNRKTGFVPHTAPFRGGGGGPAWGSAVVCVPYNYYLLYGDESILKRCLPAMKKWIDYLKTRLGSDGLIEREENGSWCLGDWCIPTGVSWDVPQNDLIQLPNDLFNTCIYIICMKIYKRVLDIAKKSDYNYEKEIESAAAAVNRKYLKEHYGSGIQGADVLPMYADIVPTAMKKQILKRITDNIKNNNYAFDTGIFSTGFLFNVLLNNNCSEYIYKMMTGTKFPSYGYMAKNGATSLWETWEGNGSKNHEGMGGFDFWMFAGLGGIKPLRCGFKEFEINPAFIRGVEYINISLETIYGKISVNLKRIKGEAFAEVNIPFNTVAVLKSDNEDILLECGNYEICYDLSDGKKIKNVYIGS